MMEQCVVLESTDPEMVLLPPRSPNLNAVRSANQALSQD